MSLARWGGDDYDAALDYDHEARELARDELDDDTEREDAQPAPLARPAVYGMCLACRSVEVRLNKATGTRDLSAMGEHHAYPTGYGCEVCS